MEDECLIDSNINRAGSLVQDAMLSARGMVTSTVSTFKDKLAIFKKNAREILPKLKQKIGKRFTELKQKLVRAFNDVIDYFSRNKQASSILFNIK